MIKKFISLKNIGRFQEYDACGDTSLHKLTVIYGENGKGKTTLCAVLRSLQTQETRYITEKRSLGAIGTPEANLLLDRGVVKFKDSKWDGHEPNIEIFDSEFVNENVFSGNYVDLEHRRNLLHFALGQQGVGHARKNDELDTTIRAKSTEIKNKENEINAHTERKIGVTQFIALQPLPDIDDQIAEKEKEIQRLAKSDSLSKQKILTTLPVPRLELGAVQTILAKQIEDVSAEAERRAKEHIQVHKIPEKWIEQGLGFANENMCPFCGHALDQNDLLTAFRGYFNLAYAELKHEIAEHIRKFNEQDFPSNLTADLRNIAETNNLLMNFWDDYITIERPSIDVNGVSRIFDQTRQMVLGHLSQKSGAPLDSHPLSAEFAKWYSDYQKSVAQIGDYSVAVKAINLRIEEVKRTAGAGNLVTAKDQLEHLKLLKKRFTPSVVQTCVEYTKLIEEKGQLDAEKKAAKSELDRYTTTVLQTYQDSINGYLEKFGTDFRIVETKPSFLGGKSSSQYCIEINQQRIDLGDDKTTGTPCFKTALSDGDKNALAFAFFVSRLDHDPDLADQVVVIDDPISSMDHHRKEYTCQSILRIALKAKQVIVLSHDPSFLWRIREGGIGLPIAELQLARVNQQTAIKEWDIVADTQSDYFRNYNKLVGFLESGSDSDLRDIIRCMRPLLEGNLRMRFPRDFLYHEWLGDYVGRIRKATVIDRYFSLQPDVDEFAAINDYSKRYHHGSNPTADTEPVSDTEVQTFAKRTLKLVGG